MPISSQRRQRRRALALAVGLALAFAGTRPAAAAPSESRRTPVVEAVRKVQPSVVSITSEKKAASTARWPFSSEESQRPRVSGMGTGVIVDERGFILTNHHVVDKVQGIEVHLPDGTTYPARLLQHDEAMDLALLKVDAGRPLQAIAVGTSADLMVGETVITLGNAFGYENTVSVGIISALGRDVTLSDEQVYRRLIQTDACINPGNSGGPLVNIDGELIGINVATRAGAQGIGFALPIDDVKRVAADMLSTRKIAGTWHGLVASDPIQGDARPVVVSEVQSGSPAEGAGFRAGDQVVRINDRPVTNAIDIERGMLDATTGSPARVFVRRAGQEMPLTLEPQPLPRAFADSADQIWRSIGVKTTPVTNEHVAAASPKLRGGLFVRAVMPGSPASRAAIQPGDILVGMNVGTRHWETVRPENVLYILRQPEVSQTQSVQFYFVRKNGIYQGAINLADNPRATAVR